MGLFVIPENTENPTVEELVDTAIANIELWKKNTDCGYLLEAFAVKNLLDASEMIKEAKINPQ